MIEENLSLIRKKIGSAAEKTSRKAGEIRIVAVTKTVGAGEILEVSRLGIMDIGENKVQEALIKHREIAASLNLPSHQVKWHMIGHLQTNKCAKAVEIFDLIQSVDSTHIAEEINKQAVKKNKIQDCLVEIKVSEEPSKTGLEIPRLDGLLEQSMRLKNIRFCGLMAMAPFFDDPEKTRPYFRRSYEIYAKYAGQIAGFDTLSMGMSQDFEIAVEEGSNMVRIGTAIFGEKIN